MNLKKIIILLLVIQALIGTFFEVTQFFLPSWIRHMYLPDIFEFARTLTWLFGILSYVLTFVGVIQIIQNKNVELFSAFKFPIFLLFAENIFWFITTSLSTEYSFFIPGANAPWHFYLYKTLSLALLILISIHYLNKNKEEDNAETILAGKGARFFNWIIDLSIILSFSFGHMKTLSQGYIFEDIAFLNSSASWFIFINMFWYYLILELFFHQTIGKLHNNSYVHFEGSKFKAILLRTLCRFIPFEAFSFFGKEGWHDSISKTKVTVPTRDKD
ncbi:MAG TPA: hypothetical protein DIW47_02035 [Bacteroidetes bacterium]|nr:hypothetical protein [Bacteroidota bacterium]